MAGVCTASRTPPALPRSPYSPLLVVVARLGRGQGRTRRQSTQRPATVRTALGTARSLGRPQPLREAHRAAAGQADRTAGAAAQRTLRSACAATARPASRPPRATPKYWGAWIGSQLTGEEAPWDMGAIDKFEQHGRQAGLGGQLLLALRRLLVARPAPSTSSRPTSMESIREHGSIPFFSWASQATPASLNQPELPALRRDRRHPRRLHPRIRRKRRDWGHPFFLRFNWEMNGDWFAWMEGVNGNQPGESVAAWRHVHDIFTAVGADQRDLGLVPERRPGQPAARPRLALPRRRLRRLDRPRRLQLGHQPRPLGPLAQLRRPLPLDLRGDHRNDRALASRWRSRDRLNRDGGSKSAWIEDALSSVATDYPQVRALLWFEKFDDGMDWPIETSSSATSAFAAGIQNPSFLANSYANLGPGPVPAAELIERATGSVPTLRRSNS